MKTIRIPTLDDAPLAVAEWLDLLQEDRGWPDHGAALFLWRKTVPVVCDFLTVQEEADLSTQLPLMIRGVVLNGRFLAKTPAGQRATEDFVNCVKRPFADDPQAQPDVAVEGSLAILRRHICRVEDGQVLLAKRKPLRALWM